ncbi:PhzF family phenazine biosynthesis protein [Burkholderia sp. Ac-20345]|uniref:PhzF family phenazine biosynthesis protein n=1 Tax=Burkholderia sp. Ac-20345 TaxID=2703891 RepID=UPI00197BABEC|nr:PhzF family phenazine biosynthesis isomerase [Burkholderia sp. Ac-20345]MBN3776399.1 PhzF family phenazine biosynthesis protein [Burkholderia sp. Ac-20345]
MSVENDLSLLPHSPNSTFALRPHGDLHFVRVFPAGPGGGNPAPVVLDADAMSADEMKAIAARYGHESAFVCAPSNTANAYCLRFFVPHHEMEMCGHATLGALWLLRRLGRWTSRVATLETLSGIVDARFDESTQSIEVSQPKGIVHSIEDARLHAAICDVLRIDADDLDALSIVNATTSRTKTLIPIRSVQRLHALTPSFEKVQALCDQLESTGLYPFAVERTQPLEAHARQFPRSSGYPEDAATGIAAAATLYGALHYGLLAHGAPGMTVHQGYAMRKPSSIRVKMRDPDNADAGCWISGAVESMMLEPQQ